MAKQVALPINQSQLEFSRINSLGQAQAVSVSRHEDIIYELKQYKFPLTQAEFDSEFGNTIPIFAENQPTECPGRQISPLLLDGGFELDDFFWLTGISLAAFGEPKSFTINGGLMTRPAVATATPCFDGCPPTEGEPLEQGSLYWGGPTWQFLYNFLNAYRFRWLIKRFEFLNVSASALGITHMGPAFEGAGCSQVPAMPYIQAANAAMADKEIPLIFLPQNSAGETPECVGAPTADVVYGAPQLNGSLNRPFCLTNPMLLAPGMHLKMAFEAVEGDCCYRDGMQRNAVIPTSGLPDPILTAGTCESSARTIPAGCVTLGVILQGYVMNDDACWEALTRNQAFIAGSPMHNILKGNAAITNLIQRRTRGMQSLAGVSPEVVKSLKSLSEATGG